MSGTLYIVATPIGNLEDVTLRGVSTLCDADIIIAEDTRVSRKLLDFIVGQGRTVEAKIISYHQHSGENKKLEVLNYLLSGKNVALITDAGTPGISDPGNELIDFLLSYNKDLKIIPIPGASAITAALSVSGFNVNKFVFLGFLPKKKRNKLLDWLKTGKIPFGFYESPHRIVKTLGFLEETLSPEVRVFVGRELTKIYETLYRGTISQVKESLAKERVKGELVVIVELE